MTASVLRRIAFAALRNSLFSACLLGSVLLASGQDYRLRDEVFRADRSVGLQRFQAGTSARSIITLDPPTGWDLQLHAFDAEGNRLPETPANYQRLGQAKVGEPSALHTLTLRFHEALTLDHVKSTADFPIAQGGTCVEGGTYAANSTCSLLVRFTPQGAGHRLGFITIEHSASATPALVGLTGNGYTPVVSFTPSLITTVAPTVSSGVGIIDSATSLTVDGGDNLYIADTGNDAVREIDSSGAITTTPAFLSGAVPVSIAVDSTGIVYAANVSGDYYYFTTYFPWDAQTYYPYTYKNTACTSSAPCAFSSVGMSGPAQVSIDPYDNLFMEEKTKGALEMPVGDVAGGSGALNLWHLSDTFAYANGSPLAFAADANDNLYTYYTFSPPTLCWIVEEPLYEAEDGNPTFTRVAGAARCGYSGDGGQGRGAEISSSVGQITFDIANNLYFTDSGNQRVRRIDAVTGIIRTIAGNGTAGYTGDGGAATAAELNAPTGLAVDSQGQVYILSHSATTGTAQVVRKVETTGKLAFPSTVEAKSSATLLLNVANTGNDTLSFVRDTITGADPGDFSIDPNTTSCNFAAGNYLYAGQDCQIGVIFKPAAAGARSATLNLVDNTVNAVNTVNLTGTGTAPAVVKVTSPTASKAIPSETEITLAASVTSAHLAPTGKVSFSVDGKLVAAGEITEGEASVKAENLAAGSHHLVAAYSGDKYHPAATASETFTVAK